MTDVSFRQVTRDYLNALLIAERQKASQMILGLANQGVGIKDIYLQIFQPSQYEVGRLWQSNKITVAQEHYCSAATQLIMSQLYPYIFGAEKLGRKLVATCVGGELHEIGVRMVADFFEMEGWDTYYVGANVPAKTILDTIDEHQTDVLGISATMYFYVPEVRKLISQVRESDVGKDFLIMVGGHPFLQDADLWQKIGADGLGRDAQNAVDNANKLIQN